MSLEDDPLWAPHTARFNLLVAVEAFRSLAPADFKQNGPRWYLNYASTIVFCRAAVDALRNADGQRNSLVAAAWKSLFESSVRTHPVFIELISVERHVVAHGKLNAAIHPQWPLDTVFRHGGIHAIFGDGPPKWPDGQFGGRDVEDVLEVLITQVRDWIESVDAEASDKR